MQTRPDFLVIGAMKCATSTICAYLEEHPQVYMMPRAEPNFFSHDENWARGPDWYATFFEGARPDQICGEGSNDYAAAGLYPKTVERIHGFCPDARLVYMVRHPIQRIVSAWVQNRQNKGDYVSADIDKGVTERMDLYVDQSSYWAQLQRYRRHFPDERIFVGFMEDLKTDEAAFMARLCDFLEVDFAPPAAGQKNPSLGKEIPNEAYSAVSRIPGLRGVARTLLPADLRGRIKRKLFYTRLDARPVLSPRLRDELATRLEADSAAFLRHCGRSPDFWNLRAE